MTDADQLLTPDEVADWLGVSRKTLYKWRGMPKGPPGFLIGGVLRYRRGDVADWLAAAYADDQSRRDDEMDAADRAAHEAQVQRDYCQ